MVNKNPRVALVGLGYWGKNIARNLYALNVLNAICDNSAVNLKKYKNLYPDINYYSNIDSLLESDIEAIVIATPAITHGDLVKKALDANKHVFVEKPLCLDVNEGSNLVDLAKKKKLNVRQDQWYFGIVEQFIVEVKHYGREMIKI